MTETSCVDAALAGSFVISRANLPMSVVTEALGVNSRPSGGLMI
jgi:hypothetical protein